MWYVLCWNVAEDTFIGEYRDWWIDKGHMELMAPDVNGRLHRVTYLVETKEEAEELASLLKQNAEINRELRQFRAVSEQNAQKKIAEMKEKMYGADE